MPIFTKLVVAVGGAALSLMAGSGIASAGPDTTAIVNSTCTYQQVIDALNQQNPDVASQFTSSMLATGWLQGLIAAPPGSDARRQKIEQAQAFQQVQENTPLINSVAYTCKNF